MHMRTHLHKHVLEHIHVHNTYTYSTINSQYLTLAFVVTEPSEPICMCYISA